MTHYLPVNHSAKLLSNISNFVEDVIHDRNTAPNHEVQQMATLLFAIIDEDHYAYCESIILFYEAVLSVTSQTDFFSLTLGDTDLEAIKDFIWDNKNRYIAYKARLSFAEARNETKVINYVTQLTNHYARLLSVRVDLSYLKEFSDEVSIEDFADDCKRLRDYISNKDHRFRKLEGYIWALEQGIGGDEDGNGYHCHLHMFYNGERRQNDWYLAEEISRLWSDITEGTGKYNTSNDTETKDKYRELGMLGVGMVHRDNDIECKNAINVATYLARPSKDNQHLRVKLKNMRTFGTGQFETSRRRYKH